MTVRFKLALTIFATGIVTALLVIVTVIYAFQRFERETAYRRGSAFLQRVVGSHDNLFELYARRPDEFQAWLSNLVLFEPDSELYLLDPGGVVLACSGTPLPAGVRVALTPVLRAVGQPDAAYVMGDDPKRMDADAIVAVQPVRRTVIGPADPVAGYLYLVLHNAQSPEGRWATVRMSIARPALGLIVAVVAFTTLLAVLIIASVTRPLQRLTDAVASISQRGLDAGQPSAPAAALPPVTRDEFGQLTRAFEMMLATLRRQWGELRRLDHFRREGVSNLSHDLRSPLTATVACLETLEGRWPPDGGADPARAEDRRLVEIALRNTRNAARLVQSLGDLSKLDEPEFKLHPEVVDLGELLDDIALRFAERAAQQGVRLRAEADDDAVAPAYAAVDVELFERAIANLVDNALKFCPRGARVTLAARAHAGEVRVSVADTGPGIAPADLPHLFDRFYQSRQSVAPATGEGGKGLGLAIVKRIAELHGGAVAVSSSLGAGTQVVLSLPAPGGAARLGADRDVGPGNP
ncbi:MAG TPA: HAMP domain-containing sensor histidine kinase [Burkholderiaceae bacterium]|nr:HAMP domain-containing sensor histidine kinase [Burkholderiaceae bacterium]